ncbi:hypothetical protein GCK72_008168 [Caenorhabditis remanei]|uniref:Uncharacterized protein n=1 Tax=Caenorhabditis remanei TaxID=31234 RepID=A0A6A5GZU8_CAERE|nr:hypothetical protein GCK72_008168 [Caenorhabditis remanei]KAF1759923.1 hypothetical protein GCK72_008168 [Caenorhabditis remanei]
MVKIKSGSGRKIGLIWNMQHEEAKKNAFRKEKIKKIPSQKNMDHKGDDQGALWWTFYEKDGFQEETDSNQEKKEAKWCYLKWVIFHCCLVAFCYGAWLTDFKEIS